MDVVEGFQTQFVDSLERASDADGAVETAGSMVSWTRTHPLEARLLLLHRRQDFVAGDWPPALVERAGALEPQLGGAMRAFAERAWARSDKDVMARLRFALLDAPFGGLKPYVQAGGPVPRLVDELVATMARAVLGTINAKAPGGSR
jgi:hypothetical protein